LPSQTGRFGSSEKVLRLRIGELRKKKKFFLKKLAGLKRSCTFAAALRTKVRRAKKQEEHVHRHIGLTA
jgi:hypothetical protein